MSLPAREMLISQIKEKSMSNTVKGRLILMFWGVVAGFVIWIASTQDNSQMAKDYMAKVAAAKAVATSSR